jgi:hypothetical protein
MFQDQKLTDYTADDIEPKMLSYVYQSSLNSRKCMQEKYSIIDYRLKTPYCGPHNHARYESSMFEITILHPS